MPDMPDELIDAYAEELGIAECSFEMMGKLLDENYLKKRISYLKEEKLYVYGGGYLGIQFYQTCKDLIKIHALVDKRGCLQLSLADIPVIDFEHLKNIYNGEKIIIASVRYYQEIRKELLLFVPEDRILFLGEFLGGII